MKNAVVVITGATSGIGLATAMLMARNGSPLALIARNQGDLSLAKGVVKGPSVKTYSCDVGSSSQVHNTFAEIISDFGSIRHLANCAGVTHSQPIESDTEEGFDEEVLVNLKGTYLCIMASYKHMREGSAIVNFSSLRARTGAASSSPGYAAAKTGVTSLTKTFGLQLAPRGIRVNCIAPGATYPTRITNAWSQEKRKKNAAAAPLNRLAAPQDIAYAVEFLLSDKASFITGHTLDINGGAWMN